MCIQHKIIRLFNEREVESTQIVYTMWCPHSNAARQECSRETMSETSKLSSFNRVRATQSKRITGWFKVRDYLDLLYHDSAQKHNRTEDKVGGNSHDLAVWKRWCWKTGKDGMSNDQTIFLVNMYVYTACAADMQLCPGTLSERSAMPQDWWRRMP